MMPSCSIHRGDPLDHIQALVGRDPRIRGLRVPGAGIGRRPAGRLKKTLRREERISCRRSDSVHDSP